MILHCEQTFSSVCRKAQDARLAIECAMTGEREPLKFKEYALAGISADRLIWASAASLARPC